MTGPGTYLLSFPLKINFHFQFILSWGTYTLVHLSHPEVEYFSNIAYFLFGP